MSDEKRAGTRVEDIVTVFWVLVFTTEVADVSRDSCGDD